MQVLQWLMWQIGGFGPMLGQAHHFNAYAPICPDGAVVLPYSQARYTNEAGRLYSVLDQRLADHDYVAADQYSIADMAIFPWCRLHGRGRDCCFSPHFPLLQSALPLWRRRHGQESYRLIFRESR